MDLKKNINFNKNITAKRDINLFLIHKSGKGKSDKKDMYQVLTVAICCLFVIIGMYAGFYVYELTMNMQIGSIEKKLEQSEIVELQKSVTSETEKNQLLYNYLSIVKNAKTGFDKELIIDSTMLKVISDSVPAKCIMTSANIATQKISLSFITLNMDDAAIIKQALDKTEKFTNVNYESVNWTDDEDYKGYKFDITCYFKEPENEDQ